MSLATSSHMEMPSISTTLIHRLAQNGSPSIPSSCTSLDCGVSSAETARWSINEASTMSCSRADSNRVDSRRRATALR